MQTDGACHLDDNKPLCVMKNIPLLKNADHKRSPHGNSGKNHYKRSQGVQISQFSLGAFPYMNSKIIGSNSKMSRNDKCKVLTFQNCGNT